MHLNNTPEDLAIDESGNGSQLDSLKLVERVSAPTPAPASSTAVATVEPNWKTETVTVIRPKGQLSP